MFFGQDNTMVSGVSILASRSRPSRHRNSERVYSADCLPDRVLNLGGRAGLAKKFA